jgi:hypothetical protein
MLSLDWLGGCSASDTPREDSRLTLLKHPPLAKEQAYRHGTLQGSVDEANGAVLPADYAQTMKPIGERRVTLAGDRLADVLRPLFA